MTPTKLLVGQIVTVFAIVLLGFWFATQWTAMCLGYQPELGQASFRLLRTPIYRPWAFLGWWYHFDAYAPAIFSRAGEIAGSSGIAACAAAILGSLWRARKTKHVTTYGSAHWASIKTIEKAALFEDAGVFLGRMRILYAEEEKTLARVATFLSDPERSFADTLTRMMRTNHLGTAEEPRVHPVVASAARELLNKSENERSGVLSTAMSFLGLYRDPTVAAVTSAARQSG